MPQLPQIKPTELLGFFRRQGFVVARQTGSHARLVHPDGRKITLAMHNRPVAVGTMRSILRQANLDTKQFLHLYQGKNQSR